MKIRIGTRGSHLALVQTNWVANLLKKHHPTLECEINIIKTKGDLIQDVSLEKIGDKGLFVKEIEQQLLDGEIDLAVHSMKDMPSMLPVGLKLAASPKRADPRDVLILRSPYHCLADLPLGATIGTGSKRRSYQLQALRPDLKVVPVRGNIETRMAKIETEHLDGIVLAAAGMIRGGYEDQITAYLSEQTVVPAPAQGVLALEIREADLKMAELLQIIADEETEVQIAAERGFLKGVEGTCHQPIGAYCFVTGDTFKLTGLFGDELNGEVIQRTVSGSKEAAHQIGFELGISLRNEVKARHGR
ncbi:MAG: hydroxymethylbilane synthase [Defluviitaleaceae bacterium]|nr:hydroxymethylbilane synthase [Defluviitaleaceae bacterium]